MVQSEYYTAGTEPGVVESDRQAVTDEDPSLVVFNGAVGALAGDHALQMEVGERARIHFVNAGLNLDSNFHPIGSHWDKVYPEAALLQPPLRGSQTTLVPAGGGTVVVSGEEQPEIFAEVDGAGPGAAGESGAVEVATADGEEVTLLPGSGDFQELDSPDEFDDGESPADYSVNVLTVPAGTTVTWSNEDSMMHSVTSTDGTFDSGLLDGGDTFSYTFEEPGEYEYFCPPHPWIRAKVVVEG